MSIANTVPEDDRRRISQRIAQAVGIEGGLQENLERAIKSQHDKRQEKISAR